MSTVIQAFLSVMNKYDAKRERRIPKYERAAVFNMYGGGCAYCRTPIDFDKSRTWAVIQLVPEELGGRRDKENNIPVCWKCRAAYVNCDGFSAIVNNSSTVSATHTEALLEKRLRAFLVSSHHLTAVPTNGRVKRVEKAILERVKFERFKVYVQHNELGVLIGMSRHCGSEKRMGEVKALLKFFACGSEIQTSNPSLTLYQFPKEKLLDVVWGMIEENGLVVEVKNSHSLVEERTDEYRADWRLTYNTITHNHQRKNRKGQVEPVKEKGLSTNPRTIQNRERYRRTVQAQRWRDELRTMEHQLLGGTAGLDRESFLNRYLELLQKISSLP